MDIFFPDWLSLLVINKIYQSTWLFATYRLIKLILRLTTNTTELSRLCGTAAKGARRMAEAMEQGGDEREKYALAEELEQKPGTVMVKGFEVQLPVDLVFRIDRSILYSKQLMLERRELESKNCELDDVTQEILIKKRFPSFGSPKTLSARFLHASLGRIADSYRLVNEINVRVNTKYDSSNKAHERKLMELWDALMPNKKLESRNTSQWQEIGFQGKNPATDFRGMGILGLDDLLYYARTYPDSAQSALATSRHPVSWYPVAITGIHITQFAVQTLRTRQLQYFLFQYGTTKVVYHEFYCYLYHTFNAFWTSHENLTVMDFEEKFRQFKIQVEQELLARQVVVRGIRTPTCNKGRTLILIDILKSKGRQFRIMFIPE